MVEAKTKVLLVEDDKIDQMAFKRLLKDENLSYRHTIAESVSKAKTLLDSESFDIVITDFNLGDGTAFDICDIEKDTPIIIATGAGDEGIAVKAMKAGAYDYLIKDPERNYLKILPLTVENAIRHKTAEDQFRLLSHAMMSINDSVYITDLREKIIFVNETFLTTYGYDRSAIIGKNISIIYSPKVSSKVVEKIKTETLQNGWQGEILTQKKDGSEFPIYLSTSVVYNESGQPVSLTGVAKDITELKRNEEALKTLNKQLTANEKQLISANEQLGAANQQLIAHEQALRESEERYRTLFENIPIGLYRSTPEGKITHANPALVKMLGYRSPSQLTAANLEKKNFYCGFSRQEFRELLERDNEIRSLEVVCRKKDDSLLHIRENATAIRDEKGNIISYEGTIEDITEHKQAENALKMTQFSVDHAAEPVFWIGKDARFAYVNEAACNALAYSREELLKMTVHDIDPNFPREAWPEHWENLQQQGTVIIESCHRRKDGKDLTVEITANYIEYEGLAYSCAFARDITERKKAEDMLRNIAEGVSAATGEAFFLSLVQYLCKMLQVDYAFVGELVEGDKARARTIAVHAKGKVADNFEYDLANTLCENVVGKEPCCYPANVQQLFPLDHLLVEMGIDSYMGIPLFDSVGESLGLLVVLDSKPLSNQKIAASMLQIFATRASAELERRRAENIQRQSERRFHDLFENSPDAIFVEDLDGFVLDVNKAACNMHKLSREELIGMNMLDLVPESQREQVKQGWQDFVAGNVTDVEGYGVSKDGQKIPVEIKAARMDYLDRPAVLLHVRDISFRKQAEESLKSLNQQLLNHQKELSAANQQLTASMEQLKANQEALRESEERIRLIIDSAQDAVITMDEKGRITEWNAQAEKVFGWSRSEALRTKLADKIIPEQFREAHAKGLKRFLAKGKSSVLNKRHGIKALHRNGTKFYAELTITPLKIGGSTIFSGFIRDITERKKAEKELKAAQESVESANFELRKTNDHLEQATLLAKEMAMQAEMASCAKSEFLANMSHEIRTPLNAIIGMTELTLETQLNSEQQGYLNVVQSSSEGLLSLINDILDFSKIEAGQMEIEHIELSLRDVVEGVAEMLGTQANAKGVEMLCYIDPEIPAWLVGDPTRLRQILINLTGNAIKFTEQGDVAIMVEFCQQKNDAVKLHFKVSDTGVGISSEKIDKIFEKFSQEDTSTTRKFGGTGLGLNISKSLVELMGGELWAESDEGKGSVFQFKITMPIGQRTDNSLPQPPTDFKTSHILVVDDNETNRFILRKMLESWEFQVTEAQSGPHALSILKKSKHSISLALLDQRMPEMDGLELAQKIRKDEAFKETRLIMLSSSVNFDREILKKIDISKFIMKPIKQETLFGALLKALGEQHQDGRADQVNKISEPVAKTIRGNILLVEDNPSNQKLAKKILEKRGYDVAIAENGRQAVEAFTKFRHDLILMDIYMPEMDGFEATHEIRTWEAEYKEPRVPIVALTAHAIEGYREKCLENDMDEFVTKPIKKKILYDVIDQWLDARPTILIVDDADDNRNLLLHHLKRNGKYQLITANNGEEAVKIFKRRPVSIILMDMEMPVMDGRTATRRIRTFDNGQDVPILALTAHNDKKHLDQAIAAGYTDFLTKPIRKKNLFGALNQYLEQQTVVHRVDKLPQAELS